MKAESTSLITRALLALILLCNVACSGGRQPVEQWEPIESVPGAFRRYLVGNITQLGPYQYQLKIPAGARLAAHKHSVDVHVKVLSGSMFIIMGEPLDSSRAQHFVTGNVFVVPANTWHDEWWDADSVLEAEGVGPMETVYTISDKLMSRVDHIVYATTDLDRGVDEIEKLLGVRATAGGQHPGRGTRNALIALGPTAYLEIIAPDPDQPPPNEPRPFGIDSLRKSKLVAWFVRGSDLETLRRDAVGKGVLLGEVRSGSRRQPDGVQLQWKFTDPSTLVADGIVPLFIDWADSPHPASTAAKGAKLVSLRAEHPNMHDVRAMLQHLDVDLPVNRGNSPALIAVIAGPRGRVELR